MSEPRHDGYDWLGPNEDPRPASIAKLKAEVARVKAAHEETAELYHATLHRIAELEAEVARLTPIEAEAMEAQDIIRELKAAVLAEREACAKIADNYNERPPNGDWSIATFDISAAIRARPAP